MPNGYCSMLSWDLNPGSLVPYCLNHLYNMVFLRQASVSSEDQALLRAIFLALGSLRQEFHHTAQAGLELKLLCDRVS